MTNQISHFYFQHLSVRIQIIDNEPWFCLSDVCEVLSIDRTSDLTRVAKGVVLNQPLKNRGSLDPDGVRKTDVTTIGGKQQALFINEPNLYRVIFRSNKPEARQFQDWVFNDVLPSIRKTGSYHTAKAPAMAEENGSPQKPLDRRRGSYKNRKSELPSGVYHNQSKYNPYRATARINGKFVHVGSYPTVEDAVAAIERFYETGTVQRLHELKTKPHINISNVVPKITNSTVNQTDLMSHLKVFLEAAQLLRGYQYGKDLAWDLIAFTQEEASRHC